MKDSHILAFVGEQRAGKGTVADIYKNIAEYPYYDSPISRHTFSDIVRELLNEIGMPLGRKVAQDLVMELIKRYGDDTLSKRMEEQIWADPNQRIILDGVRLWTDYFMLKRFPSYHLVYITAPVELRHERALKSAEKADEQNLSLEEFCTREEHRLERSIPWIGMCAKHKIQNTGTIEELIAKVRGLQEMIRF